MQKLPYVLKTPGSVSEGRVGLPRVLGGHQGHLAVCVVLGGYVGLPFDVVLGCHVGHPSLYPTLYLPYSPLYLPGFDGQACTPPRALRDMRPPRQQGPFLSMPGALGTTGSLVC
jgi:hypothetical protein